MLTCNEMQAYKYSDSHANRCERKESQTKWVAYAVRTAHTPKPSCRLGQPPRQKTSVECAARMKDKLTRAAWTGMALPVDSTALGPQHKCSIDPDRRLRRRCGHVPCPHRSIRTFREAAVSATYTSSEAGVPSRGGGAAPLAGGARRMRSAGARSSCHALHAAMRYTLRVAEVHDRSMQLITALRQSRQSRGRPKRNSKGLYVRSRHRTSARPNQSCIAGRLAAVFEGTGRSWQGERPT
jgi:hypothetical protein